MGAAGMNIEDQIFPKRCGHMKGKEVIQAKEMAGKVNACAEVRNRMDSDFIINARTDAYAVHGLEETMRRCNLYLEAGADMVFIDGIQSKKEIETAIGNIHGLLSVNLMDAVSGVRTELIPIPELAAMGVARVSIPVASILVVHKALMDFFLALKQSPNGILLGQTQWLTSFQEYNQFLGMEEYRRLEKKYLPAQRLQEKYSAKLSDLPSETPLKN
jgi:2,3-dimethylmalate lyase